MKEKAIIKKIQTYLKSVPQLFFWKEHGGQYGTAGIPDLICCYRGQFVAFEVKVPGRKPTELQTRTIEQILRAGGCAVVVTGVLEVRAVLNALANEPACK